MRVSFVITTSTVRLTIRVAVLLILAFIASYGGLHFGNGPDREGAAYIAMGLELVVPPAVIFCAACTVFALMFRRWSWAFNFFAPTMFMAVFLLSLEYHLQS
jgi:hypothetical protein